MVFFKDAECCKGLKEKKVHCTLCPRSCFIDNGEAGKCDVRQNMVGKLKSRVYGKPYRVDYSKIESNSVYHFLPNSETLNIATPGTNLKGGKFWGDVTDVSVPTLNQKPHHIIGQAEKTKTKVISFLGEPFIYLEYMKDIMDKDKKRKYVISTNGYFDDSVIKKISKKAEAVVFDVRVMNDEAMNYFFDANIEPVLKSIKAVYDEGKWVEIKMMLIPGIHDDFYDVRKVVSFILNELGPNVPLHFIKFNGENISTSEEMLQRARRTALDTGINYVYIDNTDDAASKSTFCPNCRKPVIIRDKNNVEVLMKKGKCQCGQEIPGVWE